MAFIKRSNGHAYYRKTFNIYRLILTFMIFYGYYEIRKGLPKKELSKEGIIFMQPVYATCIGIMFYRSSVIVKLVQGLCDL